MNAKPQHTSLNSEVSQRMIQFPTSTSNNAIQHGFQNLLFQRTFDKWLLATVSWLLLKYQGGHQIDGKTHHLKIKSIR